MAPALASAAGKMSAMGTLARTSRRILCSELIRRQKTGPCGAACRWNKQKEYEGLVSLCNKSPLLGAILALTSGLFKQEIAQ